jgi:hypothetical protein
MKYQNLKIILKNMTVTLNKTSLLKLKSSRHFTWVSLLLRKAITLSLLKPGIDCARLPLEAVFVSLPRKVDTTLPRTN